MIVASQLHGRRTMGSVMPVGHKNEALSMKLGMHLQYDSPTDMEQRSESFMSMEVWISVLL